MGANKKDKSWMILPVLYVQNVARIVFIVYTVHFLKNWLPKKENIVAMYAKKSFLEKKAHELNIA